MRTGSFLSRMLMPAAAAVAFGATSLATATPVTLFANGYAYGSENFNISLPAINVNAGAFGGTIDTIPSTGAKPIIFFCFELTQYFSPPVTMTYDDTVMTGGQYTLLSELFTEAFAGPNGVNMNQPVNSAAFQLAVWEILQEPTPASLTTGTFQATSGDGTAINAATALISGLPASGIYDIHLLHNPDTQDFIYGTVNLRFLVPEPSSLLLIAIALAGMGFALRRARTGNI